MRSALLLTALFLAAAPLAAHAQATPEPTKAELEARVRAIFNIPTRADEVRRAGVPDSTVRGVLDILKGQNVPPEQVEEILTTERDAAREHGPTDNFGAFVQARLAEGLRGRELAAAIRAEHAARGRGPGARGARPDNAGKRPDDAGKRPDNAGKRPDNAGKRPDNAGKRPDSTGAARGKRPN